MTNVLWPEAHVGLILAGELSIEARALARIQHFVAGPGSATIWPAGHELTSLSWTGSCVAVDVQMDVSILERLAQEDDHLAGAAFTPQLGIRDAQLAALVRAMEAEINTGCQAGRLYGESLSLALAAYVSGRYAVAATQIQPLKGGLSPHQLKRVLEYIHGHFQRGLGLGELAGSVPLSPHRFCTLFAKSMGLTPHQYVLRQRIGTAKRLLATRRMSIAEVALTLGFANQSHFTDIFRKVTGITPRRYQQER
jgi:AraC family transcriptional regulator